jgi:O-acetyl-ADP-ribose deacetylase (regulator of RNase III)
MARIQYQRGDIFDSRAQVIVNPVNCKGVMGKGLAFAFKQRYPEMFAAYQQQCRMGKLRIGRPMLYRGSTPWILNFPTKDDWRLPSKLEYLEQGLAYVVANYKKDGIICCSSFYQQMTISPCPISSSRVQSIYCTAWGATR